MKFFRHNLAIFNEFIVPSREENVKQNRMVIIYIIMYFSDLNFKYFANILISQLYYEITILCVIFKIKKNIWFST